MRCCWCGQSTLLPWGLPMSEERHPLVQAIEYVFARVYRTEPAALSPKLTLLGDDAARAALAALVSLRRMEVVEASAAAPTVPDRQTEGGGHPLDVAIAHVSVRLNREQPAEVLAKQTIVGNCAAEAAMAAMVCLRRIEVWEDGGAPWPSFTTIPGTLQ